MAKDAEFTFSMPSEDEVLATKDQTGSAQEYDLDLPMEHLPESDSNRSALDYNISPPQTPFYTSSEDISDTSSGGLHGTEHDELNDIYPLAHSSELEYNSDGGSEFDVPIRHLSHHRLQHMSSLTSSGSGGFDDNNSDPDTSSGAYHDSDASNSSDLGRGGADELDVDLSPDRISGMGSRHKGKARDKALDHAEEGQGSLVRRGDNGTKPILKQASLSSWFNSRVTKEEWLAQEKERNALRAEEIRGATDTRGEVGAEGKRGKERGSASSPAGVP